MASETSFGSAGRDGLSENQDRNPGIASQAAVVAGLFADVFDVKSVDLDDDFFQLGGDSLLGTSLMTAIERRFGLVVSISILLESSTPRALAAAIFDKTTARVAPVLVKVQPDGSPPPILCVHGNVGESVFPLRLSNALGGSRALYGFRAIGLEAGERPLTSVEAMANTYLTAITLAHPSGPYVLLGHCAGSSIAYEMAQRLMAADKAVAGLILIDPEHDDELAPYLHKSGLALTLWQSSWHKRAAQLEALLGSDPNPTGETRRKLVAGGIKLAAGTYTPKPFGGRTLLFCTPERRTALLNRERGYPALVSDLEVVEIDSGHGAMFTKGLAEIAQAIDSFIDRFAS